MLFAVTVNIDEKRLCIIVNSSSEKSSNLTKLDQSHRQYLPCADIYNVQIHRQKTVNSFLHVGRLTRTAMVASAVGGLLVHILL